MTRLHARKSGLAVVSLAALLLLGCSKENAAPVPTPPEAGWAHGTPSNVASGSRAPGPKGPSGIYIDLPVTATSRMAFHGYEWKRDPSGSTVGSEDLPEMHDDGIEDSFTPYVTHDPNLRLFYMFLGNGHRLYVRELYQGKWVTMAKLDF